MVHSNLVLLSTAVLVLGAGVMVGRVTDRVGHGPQHEHGPFHENYTWISDQLNLTTDQQKQMDAIWSDTRKNLESLFQNQRSAEQAREKSIENLLTDSQKAQYEKI